MDRRKAKATDMNRKSMTPDSWCCIDCGINTAPGILNWKQMENALKVSVLTGNDNIGTMTFNECTEVYDVKDMIWKAADMELTGGCLCIGCLEKRLGRMLTPKDFKRNDPFAALPGTERLLTRRFGPLEEE